MIDSYILIIFAPQVPELVSVDLGNQLSSEESASPVFFRSPAEMVAMPARRAGALEDSAEVDRISSFFSFYLLRARGVRGESALVSQIEDDEKGISGT